MTVGPDGQVYMLSDESAVLIRLEGHVGADDAKVHERAFWKLPKEIVHPEGLVIDADMHPWVAVDHKQENLANLFRLTRIESP